MGVLHLPKEVRDRINEVLANFVKGRDRIIAKKRWCIDRSLGGYGLMDVHIMNACIKPAWINKWIMHGESYDINGMRSGADLKKSSGPVGGRFSREDKSTVGILREWKNYKRLFYRVGGNVWKAPVLRLTD